MNLPKGKNLFRYALNRILFIRNKKKRNVSVCHPPSLVIELTNCCQLRCTTCAREYSYGQQMDKGHMDFGRFKSLFDENHIYLDRICLSGLGETLLYPKLVEAVKYIGSKNKGIAIFVSTNASQENAAEIIDTIADKIDTLQISLDGIGSVLEHIRKKSNFDVIHANLKKIAASAAHKRMSVKYNMVVFKDNYTQMVDVINLAAELKAREVFFNTFNLAANNLDLSLYDFYHTAEFRSAYARASSIAREKKVTIKLLNLQDRKGFRYCPFPWDDFYITWDGYAVPCCAKPFPRELNFGNVFSDGLMPVLNKKEYRKFRALSKNNTTPDFCKRCHMIH